MLNTWRNNKTVKGIVYFFPFQLLLLHIQQNLIILLFWVIIAGFVTNLLGASFGMSYLFLYPEYLGEVSLWSFMIVGFAWGGFVMSFNISSFIINSHHFPFLATLERPFMKYTLNNFIIPLVFTVVYVVQIIYFLRYGEYMEWIEIIINAGAFMAGVFLFVLIALGYFLSFNKDYVSIFGSKPPKIKKKKIAGIRIQPVHIDIEKKKRTEIDYSEKWKVETYIKPWFSIARTRKAQHYEEQRLMHVFHRNQIYAAVFEVLTFASIVLLGIFREVPYLKIPAGASVLLLFTMLLLLAGAIHFILRKWSTVFFISLFLLVNYLSEHTKINIRNHAYGLNYDSRVLYNPDSIHIANATNERYRADLKLHQTILQRWKKKVTAITPQRSKPKLVVINCSGGGSKSALWTFYNIQQADQQLKGKLLEQTFLITGSSGGMIGASYIRELFFQKKQGKINDFYDIKYAHNIAADMLNPVSSSLALNDLFIRTQTFSDGKYTYLKDRGYAFEKQLNENTDYLLDKRFNDYRAPEENAEIPLMIFAPTILNDGKRLIISPLPLSFLSNNLPQKDCTNQTMIENVEFGRLFGQQDAMNLKFTSAIRMNATFPYILPVVSLPSLPSMEIMDAGLRDNYGVRTAIAYMYHLRNWINQNTSGVVIIEIHDSKKETHESLYVRSLAENLFSPLRGVVNNQTKIHMMENDQLIQFSSAWLNVPVDVVNFQLGSVLEDKQISMSLHLTTREKNQIMQGVSHPSIRASVKRLKKLLN